MKTKAYMRPKTESPAGKVAKLKQTVGGSHQPLNKVLSPRVSIKSKKVPSFYCRIQKLD